jgi:hypothetical protein
MSRLHFSQHSVEVAERVAEVSFVAVVVVLAAVSAATLIYSWFFA